MVGRRLPKLASPRVAAALLAWGLGTLVSVAAAPQQKDEPVPTFRAGVEAVSFEAFVTDEEGKPVTDLTVDDFEILENKQPQPITTFASVVIPMEPGAGTVAAWPVESDAATNDQPAGRTYVFLLDEVCAADALRTRLFLRQFLERYFNPHDIGAVLLAGRGLVRDGQTFTGNKRLLLTAIEKFSGGFAKFDTCSPGSNAYDVRQRLGTLRDVTESLATIPGRKTVLYFTMEIGFDFFSVVDYHGESLTPGGYDGHAMLSAATRANVVFYPINPMGLTPDGLRLDDKMDLTALATATGGFALQDSNSFMQAFERVQRESSAYYMLGFNSAYAKRDGRMVKVDVKVKRPGLHVRAREGYVAPLGKAKKPSEEGDTSPALSAMANPVSVSGVAMKVTATPYRSRIRGAAVSLAIEIDPDTLSLTERNGVRSGSVEVTYSVMDTAKKAYPGGRHTFPVSLTPEGYENARRNGLRVVSTVAVPKGEIELRVAAASGARTGNRVHHFVVPDFGDGRLTMSGVSLSTTAMSDTTTLRPPAGSITPVKGVKCTPPRCIVPLSAEAPSGEEPVAALDAPPVARRVFDTNEDLLLFAEAYENGRTAAHRVTMTVTLENTDHEVRALGSETRTLAPDPKGPSRTPFTLKAALRDVPPGQYLLHVQTTSDADRDLATSRAIPIEVRPSPTER
jgi:VWFA-related protein